MGLYVQYGCGLSAPASWQNFDASPTLKFEKIPIIGKLYTKNNTRFPKNVQYGDIVKGLPLSEESCAGIYASHVLEHLALEDFRIALKNTFNLLCSGGIFRLVVPDLEILTRRYLESNDATSCENFMKSTSLGRVKKTKGFFGFAKSYLGNSNHLWMWDFKSIEQELITTGFVDIRKCAVRDSVDPKFNDVEDSQRFMDAIAVECKRP